ncbi:hypothetical protein [Campylobacter sp. RM16187]|uniref:hypothetical protein n=1 Tax=Campylobacter sp. RM16187 TaxID=1660063 RepID=UPI0021B6DC9E|nr:hypothetical protein [Campylobacter sp. RM16187]QKG30287.1 hypothetical protein CDOMF_a038 [Campylobacter sp. RM16187]
MIVLVMFLVIIFFTYISNKGNLEVKSLIEFSSFILAIFTIGLFIIISSFDELKPNLFYLLPIPCILYLLKYISESIQSKPLTIVANQQRYFKDAIAQRIVKFYENRKEKKSNRIEVFVNEENKKIIINDTIRPQFFINYFGFNGTKIQNLAELEKSDVFKSVFNKVKDFIKDLEVKVDFDKELQNNNFIAEFFLMDLWERYTPKFNISVANLDILARSENEKEFLGAIDLLNLNCIKFKGAGMYYAYLEFKDRLKDFIPELRIDGVSQVNTDIIPTEGTFDEKYANENDSSKTIYKNKEE